MRNRLKTQLPMTLIFTTIFLTASCGRKDTLDSSQLIAKLKSPEITSSMASEAEKLTAKCMARQGFTYSAQKIVITEKPHEEPEVASPEFLRSHGYGISQSITGEMPSVAIGPAMLLGNGKDPNKDQIARLSEVDRLAYFTALIGKTAAQSMTQGQSAGFAPLDSPQGCRNQSERAASHNRQSSQAKLDTGLSDLQRKIDNDPKIRLIRVKWAQCMAKNGYQYKSRFEVINSLNRQAQQVMRDAHQPGQIPPGLAQLEKLEFQISSTDATCSAPDFETLSSTRRTYEDKFAKQYRAGTLGVSKIQASASEKSTVRKVTVSLQANEVLTIGLHPNRHFISVSSTQTIELCPGSLAGGIGTRQNTSWGRLWTRCLAPGTTAKTVDIPYSNRHLAIALLSKRSTRVLITYVPKDGFLTCRNSKGNLNCVDQRV